ncbi:hypothetical protein CDL12_04551 [Handroanthus impetiginosus]|uniref:Pentacotripeptide-repeat region of PRORP domain-containing protein n=1 Tax=Handroanthus impetiginosus TaxID=429701 RepID=A0A2G9HYZ3_9LAMI|nr:hypothetical protein CDL12_04551 [Handroanthus impetiginosus]
MFAALRKSNLVSYLRPSNLFAFGKSFSSSIAATSAPNANAPKYSASRCRNLFSRIRPVRRDRDIVRILDRWVAEGRELHPLEFRPLIRELRRRRRFSHALQISEWMSRHVCKLSPADCAIQLDLIGVVHGWEAPESYFNNLSEQDKNEKTYGALMNCYVREGLLTKTLLHVERMKNVGYGSSCLTYNNLMILYRKAGQLEKISEILSEMKKNGVAPNNFTYKICINTFRERSDLSSMEKLLDEIESQTDISIDWSTYSTVAYHFIKANEKEKALTYMKKLEEKLDKDALGYNHLISLYAHLGDKGEVMRLWGLQKFVGKKQINRDYITVLGSLVKLGEMEMAESVLKEWDSSCRIYDFRVPNILLIGYCQKGLIEKAEIMLRDIVKGGKKPIPNSWAIVSAGYIGTHNMDKAYECMNEALAVKEKNMKWIPKPGQIRKILEWLGDKGMIEEVEAFVQSLRTVIPVNRQMYYALIKANRRVGRDINWILESMKADDIVVDEETQKMLSQR